MKEATHRVAMWAIRNRHMRLYRAATSAWYWYALGLNRISHKRSQWRTRKNKFALPIPVTGVVPARMRYGSVDRPIPLARKYAKR